jgi:hypothetical protein
MLSAPPLWSSPLIFGPHLSVRHAEVRAHMTYKHAHNHTCMRPRSRARTHTHTHTHHTNTHTHTLTRARTHTRANTAKLRCIQGTLHALACVHFSTLAPPNRLPRLTAHIGLIPGSALYCQVGRGILNIQVVTVAHLNMGMYAQDNKIQNKSTTCVWAGIV